MFFVLDLKKKHEKDNNFYQKLSKRISICVKTRMSQNKVVLSPRFLIFYRIMNDEISYNNNIIKHFFKNEENFLQISLYLYFFGTNVY